MMRQHDNENKINRREFVNYTGKLMGLGMLGLSPTTPQLFNAIHQSKIRIKNVDLNFERETLFPYRFKGSAVTESWQTAAWLESESGIHKIGLGNQGVLWSDAKVFGDHSESGGNALMYAMSERALEM